MTETDTVETRTVAEPNSWDFSAIGKAVFAAASFIRFKNRFKAARAWVRFSSWHGQKNDDGPSFVGARPHFRSHRRKAVMLASARCGHTRIRRRRDTFAVWPAETRREKDFKGRLWSRRVNS